MQAHITYEALDAALNEGLAAAVVSIICSQFCFFTCSRARRLRKTY
jgi:hypothetical protein